METTRSQISLKMHLKPDNNRKKRTREETRIYPEGLSGILDDILDG